MTLKKLALAFAAVAAMVVTGSAVTVPDGFVRLAYVESDGTQYVDTGVNLYTWQKAAGAVVSAIEMDFTPLNAKTDTADFWGCGHGNGNNVFWQQIGYYYHNGMGESTGKTVDPGTDIKASFNMDGDGMFRMVVDGEAQERKIATAYGSANVTLKIFAAGENADGTLNKPSKMKLRAFKIYRKIDEDWVLVRDYMPCLNTATQAVGLYDKVTNEGEASFLGSKTESALIAGPAVYFDLDPIPPQVWDGTGVCEPHPTVRYWNDETATPLVENQDYTLSWSDNDRTGQGTVTVTGIGTYAGMVSDYKFDIVSAYGDGITLFVATDGEEDADCATSATAGTLRRACALAKADASTKPVTIVLMSGTADKPAIYDYSAVDITAATADTIAVCAGRANVTIRSQGLNPTNCIVRGGGTAQNKRCLVLYGNGTRLQGVTIEGFALTVNTTTLSSAGGYGAALFAGPDNNNSVTSVNVPTVSNCIFRANTALYSGGCHYGHYFGCTFLCNTNSYGNGNGNCGGAAVAQAYDLTHCQIIGNHSCADRANGGAVSPAGRATVLTDCLFESNTGKACFGSSHASGSATNCIFRYNQCNPLVDAGNYLNTLRVCQIYCNSNNAVAAMGNFYGCKIHDASGTLSTANCVGCEIWNMNGEGAGSECFLGYNSSFTNCFVHDCSCDKRAFSRCKQFEDCVFSNVTCKTFGSTTQWGSVPPFRRCAFVDCTAGDYDGNFPFIEKNGAENCLFLRCAAQLSMIYANTTVDNCTFVSNSVLNAAGHSGHWTEYIINSDSAKARNCIFYGTTHVNGNAPSDIGKGTIENSVYQTAAGGTLTDCHQYTGAGYPFKATDEKHPYIGVPKRGLGGYGLGLMLSYTDASLDLARLPRVVDGKVDAGCYQRVPSNLGLMLIVR